MLRCAVGVPGPPEPLFGYCAKFQVIAISFFCFIVLTYPHTPTYIDDKVIAINADIKLATYITEQ